MSMVPFEDSSDSFSDMSRISFLWRRARRTRLYTVLERGRAIGLDEVEAAFVRALDAHPSLVSTATKYASFLRHARKAPGRAAAVLDTVLSSAPDYGEALSSYAVLLHATNPSDARIGALYERAAKAPASPAALYIERDRGGTLALPTLCVSLRWRPSPSTFNSRRTRGAIFRGFYVWVSGERGGDWCVRGSRVRDRVCAGKPT